MLDPQQAPSEGHSEGLNRQLLELSALLNADEGRAGFEPRPLREHYATDGLIHCVHLAAGEGARVSAVKEMYPCPGDDETPIS